MAAEDLDWSVGVHGAQGVVHVAESSCAGLALSGVVADEEEEVHGARRVGDEGLKPSLIDHGGGWDDFGHIGVAGEVEENTEGQNAEAVLGSEILVLVAEILVRVGCRVEDLDIGSQVAVAPGFGKLIVVLVGNFGVVQLVISCSQSQHQQRLQRTSAPIWTYRLSRGHNPFSRIQCWNIRHRQQ